MKSHAFALLLASTTLAFSADQYWGGGSANFTNTGSWFTGPNGAISGAGAVPGSSDRAIFDYNFASGPYTVTVNQSRFLSELTLGGNDVSLALNGFDLSLTSLGGAGSNQGALVLGWQPNETGSLSIFNGRVLSSSAVIVGGQSGGNQTLFVDTAGRLSTDYGGGIVSDIRVGVNGIGALTIRNGGRATSGEDLRVGVNAGSVGTLSIDGTAGNGSRMDVLGDAIFGELGTGYGVLSNGAILTTSGRSSIGADFANAPLSLVTLQSGSLWAGNAFEVGGLSSGQLSLSGGSAVSGSSFIIAGGQQSGVTGLIELLGNSLLTATQDVSVGQEGGTGTFDIKTGSDADIGGDLRVGDTKVGNGAVLVNGAGSTLDVADEIYVGLQGTGQMTVSGGGVVTSANGTIGSIFNTDTGLPSNGTATVTGSGSVWNNTSRLYVGDEGDGILNITSGGAVNNTAGPVIIGRTVGSEGTVNVTGSGLNQPGAALNAAGQTVTVGRGGVGTLNITGSGIADAFNVNPARVVAQDMVVGDLFLSQGTVNVVQGLGAAQNVGQNLQIANRLTVGKSGTGTVNLIDQLANGDGAYVKPNEVIVGQNATGNGTLNVQGSLMEVAGAFVIGDAGTAVVNLGTTGQGSGTLYLTRLDQFVVGKQAGSNGTLNVGNGYMGTWNGTAFATERPTPIFGDAGAATVNVTGSDSYGQFESPLRTDGVILANQAGSVANVSIVGSEARQNFVNWHINADFDGDYAETIIGNAGSATLNIGDYAIVQANEVPDHPSGDFRYNRSFVLGDQVGGSGVVNVSPGGSWSGIGTVYVGDGGFGQANFTDGGTGNFSGMIVGNGSRGEVNVSRTSGINPYQVNAFFLLEVGVGAGGDGELHLENGGGLTSGEIFLGRAGGQALVTVSGANSQLWGEIHTTANPGAPYYPGDVAVGESGSGALVVENGGKALVEGAFRIGRHALGEDGATARGMGTAFIGPDGTLDVDGVTTVGAGGTGGLILQGAATLGVVDVGLSSTSIGNLIINAGNGVTSTAVRIGVAGSGTAVLDESSTWDASSVAVGVTSTGTGLLSVNGGSEFDASASLDLGVNAGSTGTLRVEGANSKARIVNDIRLGNGGSGTLEVKSGGLVTATTVLAAEDAGSTASLLVQGANSRMTLGGNLVLGQAGAASATVENGGLVTATTVYAAEVAGSTASLLVQGTNSRITLGGNLVLGQAGVSSATVENGGQLSVNHLTLGEEASGEGTLIVQDAGSTLSVTGALVVGDEGSGTLRLLDGQSITPTSVAVAQNLGSNGILELQNGSTIQTGIFDVGKRSTGSLTAGSGSQIQASFLFVGSESRGDGTMTLSGADTLATVTSVLVVGSSGDGTLNVNTGAEVTTNGFVIGSAASGDGAVTVGIGSHISAQATTVGSSGTGALTLSLGDLTTGSLLVGSLAGSEGTLTLGTGADLIVTGPTTVLANSGSAVVTQSFGAQFQAHSVILGENVGSDAFVNVTGSGTVMRADGDFFVGKGGHADLTVGGGALLETGTPTLDFTPATTVAVIAEGTGSANSRVTVQGANSRWVHHGDLSLGPNAAAGAELRVFSKALLDVDGLLDIGGSGLLTINDGHVEVQDFTVSADSMEGVDWVKGEFFFKGDKTLDGDIDLYLLHGDGIRAGRTLGAGGNFHFGTEITLNGGVLDAETLTSAALLDFQSGTLRLDYAQIGIGELFDGLLVYDAAFAATHKLEFQNTTIENNALVQIGAGATFRPGILTNRGELNLAGTTARVITNIVTNDGLITGSGRILSDVFNQSGGEVRADVDERLLLQGNYHNNQGAMVVEQGRMDVSGTLFNTGAVNVVNGSLTIDGYVYNQANLSITNGTVRFDGALENSGAMQVGGAYADIFGTVNNLTGGEIRVAGSSHAYFYDDLVNNGVVQMSATSMVTSLGSLSGSGSFLGGGTVEILGDYMPGNSPGLMIVEGNLVLGPASHLFFELAGDVRGVSYDATNVGGTFTMDGILDVVFSSGFAPGLGMVFDLFDWAEKSGMFDEINLPDLIAGWEWDLSRFESEGKIEVALEQMTYAKWLARYPTVQAVDGTTIGDHDKDGRVNLLEYALGSDPGVSDTLHANAPQLFFVEVAGQWYPALQYTRPSGAEARSDTTEVVTFSPDLSPGSWSSAGVVLHAEADDGVWQTLLYRASTAVQPGGSGFLRLGVDLTP